MSLRVAPTGHAAAEYAVKHWHYSRSLPVPPRIVYGVWDDENFLGVVIYSRGASPALGRPYGLTQGEVCELTRVALREHDAPVSQIVAATMRELRGSNPGLRAIISFADPAEGHHGGIYQAGNWLYLGRTDPTVVYFDKAGKKWHSRQVSVTGKRTQFGNVRAVVKLKDCRAVKMPGKHRYLMPLDRSTRRRLASLGQPYPPAVEVSTVTRPDSVREMPVQPQPTAL